MYNIVQKYRVISPPVGGRTAQEERLQMSDPNALAKQVEDQAEINVNYLFHKFLHVKQMNDNNTK